jgi:hypothetical protein
VLRSLHAIAAAIGLCAPTLPDAVVESYAETIQREAVEHEIDPLLVVAVVSNESHWKASADDGRGCIGLGQVCLSGFEVCQTDRHGDECAAVRTSLLDPLQNLAATAALLGANRDYCRRRFRESSARYWLQGYQGFRGRQCGRVKRGGKWRRAPVPRLTRRVLGTRAMLERRVGR